MSPASCLVGWGIVGQIDDQLGEASFGGKIVLQSLCKRSIPQRFGQALAQSLTSPNSMEWQFSIPIADSKAITQIAPDDPIWYLGLSDRRK
jgi:hypothetical protein